MDLNTLESLLDGIIEEGQNISSSELKKLYPLNPSYIKRCVRAIKDRRQLLEAAKSTVESNTISLLSEAHFRALRGTELTITEAWGKVYINLSDQAYCDALDAYLLSSKTIKDSLSTNSNYSTSFSGKISFTDGMLFLENNKFKVNLSQEILRHNDKEVRIVIKGLSSS